MQNIVNHICAILWNRWDHGIICLSQKHISITLQWRHNGRDSVSNHQPPDCLHNRLLWCRSKKISKLCVTGLSAGNSPVAGEFPKQRASNAENVSIWWRHHELPVSMHPSLRWFRWFFQFINLSPSWIRAIYEDINLSPIDSVLS